MKKKKSRKKTKKQEISFGVGITILMTALLLVLVLIFSFLPRQNVSSNSDLICRKTQPGKACTCDLKNVPWNITNRTKVCTGTGVESSKSWYYSNTRVNCKAGWDTERYGYLGQVLDEGNRYDEIVTEGGGETTCQLTKRMPNVYVSLSGGKSTCPNNTESLNWTSGNTGDGTEQIPQDESVKNCSLYLKIDEGGWSLVESGLPSRGNYSVTIPKNGTKWVYKLECEDNLVPGASNVEDLTEFTNNTGTNKVTELYCGVNNICKKRTPDSPLPITDCPKPADINLSDEECKGKTEGDPCVGIGNWTETKIIR